MEKIGSAGGKARAIAQRKNALDKYYANPNICYTCGEVIKVRDHQKVSDVRKKKFCNQKCNGAQNVRRQTGLFNPNLDLKKKKAQVKRTGRKRKTEYTFDESSRYTEKRHGNCEECDCKISFTEYKSDVYRKKRFCDSCLKRHRAKSNGNTYIGDRTKGEVFQEAKSWTHARTPIVKHAKKVFDDSLKKDICVECGYSLHIQVCHLKQVKDFSDDTLVSEINHIDNLVALCRNHHWEMDNGYLKVEEIRKKDKKLLTRLD